MANRIKALRTTAGLSLKELAAKSGTSESYLSRIESGDRRDSVILSGMTKKLCDALDCLPVDLYASVEYDSKDRLIVDDAYGSASVQGVVIVKIDGSVFAIRSDLVRGSSKIDKASITPASAPTPDSMIYDNYMYPFLRIAKRGGYNVELLRAITQAELNDLLRDHNVTDDDISGEFMDTIGDVYGDEYKRVYTARQVRVSSSDAIKITDQLRKTGIQASNVCVGCINIRVE